MFGKHRHHTRHGADQRRDLGRFSRGRGFGCRCRGIGLCRSAVAADSGKFTGCDPGTGSNQDNQGGNTVSLD